jgi:inorganic triphosphatase YgiF
MLPQRVFRFEIPDRETLERLAADPLPDGFTEAGSEMEFFREIYYDTPAADLDEKSSTVRLRLPHVGPARLYVDVLERSSTEGGVRRQTAEADVGDADPDTLFSDGSGAAGLLRGLIDAERLEPVFELEVMRRGRAVRDPGA